MDYRPVRSCSKCVCVRAGVCGCVCVACPYTRKHKPLNSGCQILACITITWRACSTNYSTPTPTDSDSVGLGTSLTMFFPSKLPGDADAAAPRTPLGKLLPSRVVCYTGGVASGIFCCLTFKWGCTQDQL